MKWEDYKRGIMNCPDNNLHIQYGIYDNFTILVRSSLPEVLFQFNKVMYLPEQSSSRSISLTNPTRAVLVVLYNEVRPFDCGFLEQENPEIKRHAAWQQKSYRTCCMLHPHALFYFDSLGQQLRELTKVCLTLGDTFQSAEMPFCLPRTLWNEEDDFRKIVYWPDEDEKEMCRK